MKIEIEIPEEFERDFKELPYSLPEGAKNQMQDSLNRIAFDIKENLKKDNVGISGRYEKEIIEMLSTALSNAKVQEENEKRTPVKALEQEPCEDAVSRKAVITIIQNHWWNCRDIDKLVSDLPPVMPTQKWIPVSEKLPKTGQDVLITNRYGYTAEATYEGHNGLHSTWRQHKGNAIWWEDEIPAWMPLPEPCKDKTFDCDKLIEEAEKTIEDLGLEGEMEYE